MNNIKKIIIICSLLIICIILFLIYNFISSNKKDVQTMSERKLEMQTKDKYENLEDFSESCLPDSIIFHHSNQQKAFKSGSTEYNKIIQLNKARYTNNIAIIKLAVDLEQDLKTSDVLEYSYNAYGSIYYNLMTTDTLKNNINTENWALVEFSNKKLNNDIYGGFLPADELINYINTLE